MTQSNASKLLESIHKTSLKTNIPPFRPGDTVRIHAKIVEGTKERIQIFEGVVIRRHKGDKPDATFTVRKVSYDIGVERTFLVHSPRIEQIELVSRGIVRRARLFYLRPLRGKATRIKSSFEGQQAMQAAIAQQTLAHQAITKQAAADAAAKATTPEQAS